MARRHFHERSEQTASDDAWSVFGSANGASFTPVLTDQTDESTHTPSGFDFYVFAEAAGTTGNVLLATVAANAVPLPPAIFLFGAALAGLGFLGRRRKEGSALQAL